MSLAGTLLGLLLWGVGSFVVTAVLLYAADWLVRRQRRRWRFRDTWRS